MTHELAKELKDAGFPSPHHGVHFDHQLWGRNYIDLDGNAPIYDGKGTINHDWFFFPNLSELIEECQPMKADSFSLDCRTAPWVAYYLYVGYFEGWPGIKRDEDGMVQIDLKIEGSTPEEAVAKLWLALQNK